MMLNQVQPTSDQIDYDIPPSTCGYPIYFSLCVDGQFERPNNSNRSLNSSSVNQPNQNSRYGYNNSDVNQYKTLNLNPNEIDGDLNVLIPNRDYSFAELLKISEHPNMANYTYDVPHPRPEHFPSNTTVTTPITSSVKQTRSDDIFPAQLVITNSTQDDPLSAKENSSKTNRFLPRSESHDLSRSSLSRINCASSRRIGHFGSTNSLPSPIYNPSSLDNLSNSLSSCDNNNSNRSSLVDQSISDTYDVPPNRDVKHLSSTDTSCNCGTSTSNSSFLRKTSCIINSRNPNYDTPLPSYQLKVNDNQPVYDVPKKASSLSNDRLSSKAGHPVKAITAITRSYSCNSDTSNQDILDARGLDLNLDGGLTLAQRLESESFQIIGKLIELSSADCWRKLENLKPVIGELTKYCNQLRCVTRELEVFTDGLYVNSLKNGSSSINSKLRRLSRQVKDSALIVISTIQSLNSRSWNVDELSSSEGSKKASHDELDQLIACMPGLKEDIKQIMSLVKSYGNLLFPEKINKQPTFNKSSYNNLNLSNIGSVSSCTSNLTPGTVTCLPNKAPPPPVPPKPLINKRPLPLAPRDNQFASENKVDSNLGKSCQTLKIRASATGEHEMGNGFDREEDEDYASLKTREKTGYSLFNSNESLTPSSSNNALYSELIDCGTIESLQKQDYLIHNSNLSVDQLISFYCPLLEEQNQNLRNSINALIAAINTKQLPKVLISLSKLVVIAGQQMIFIGDSISRNTCGEISCYVAKCSNSLCDSLKNLINNTKRAANLFPSTTALQELLDSIVQVSIHSDQLTLLKEKTQLN